MTFTIEVTPNVLPEDLGYTLTDTIPEGLTYVEGSVTGGATVNGNTLSWSGVMPVPALTYNVSTSLTDPLCDTGFGGYVDLEQFGILTQAGITGDTFAFTAFSSGNPVNFYGIDYTAGISFTDDGFAIFDVANNYGSAPWVTQAIPNIDVPNNVAASMWYDFEIFYDAALNHGVSLPTAGSNITLIEYDDIQPFGGGPTMGDMEIVTYCAVDDSPGAYEIIFAYDNLNVLPPLATIGLEDAAGLNAVAYLNSGDPSSVLSNGLMVCFDLQGAGTPTKITYQATVDKTIKSVELLFMIRITLVAYQARPA